MKHYLKCRIDKGHLNISSEDDMLLLRDCWAAVQLSSGEVYTSSVKDVKVEYIEDGLRVHCPGDNIKPELEWLIMQECGQALRLQLAVKNTTDQALALECMDVLASPTGFLQQSASTLKFSHMGWQSWSPASPPIPLSSYVPSANRPIFGPMMPSTEPDQIIAPWMVLLSTQSGKNLLEGFISANSQNGIISIQPTLHGYQLVASSHTEGIPLLPDETRYSEELFLAFGGRASALLDSYAKALAENMHARHWQSVPTGWCSWYYFFTDITEENILQNLDALDQIRSRIPIDYFQIDDGYQKNIGDWLSVNDKFPHGMKYLADAIRSHCYKTGLWFAPFLVSENSNVFTEHPSWVIRDGHGDPINAIWNWNTRNFALDTTHPEAEKWICHVVDTIVHQWGYDYLKIDFLYAAALRGIRYDKKCTSLQAYRQGLQLIRNVSGDRFILGCGAPFLPSVGLVDGMRIGPDVAPFWRDDNDICGSEPGLENAIRSTMVHGWMHPHLWINDSDCLIVREHDSELTFAEIQSWLTIVAMSGGMVMLSDDISKLAPERAAIASMTLPPSNESAIPFGPYIKRMPTRMQLILERTWERWMIACLFNWTDHAHEYIFYPHMWSFPVNAAYHIFNLWTGEHFGSQKGPVALPPIPAHGVAALQIHLDCGRPQIIGSTLHVLGGAVELSHEDWIDNVLSLTFLCPGDRSGNLTIYIPKAFEFIPTSEMDEVILGVNLLTIPVRFTDQTQISLRFKCTKSIR
jgi:alpha-galactosidase